MKITNVQVTLTSYSDEYNVACYCEGARYHVWIDKETKQIRKGIGCQNPTLYKNSIADHGQEGYYKTRYLRTDSQFSSELIRLMFEEVEKNGNLYLKAEEKLRQSEEEEHRKNREANRLFKIKESGTELYAELLPIANALEEGGAVYIAPDSDVARRLIAVCRQAGGE